MSAGREGTDWRGNVRTVGATSFLLELTCNVQYHSVGGKIDVKCEYVPEFQLREKCQAAVEIVDNIAAIGIVEENNN